MRRILHIFTRAEDPLTRELMARQRTAVGNMVEAVDLTVPEPDYKALLEKVFQADSVESW